MNRDNQVEKENGEAEIDFGNNVVNVPIVMILALKLVL